MDFLAEDTRQEKMESQRLPTARAIRRELKLKTQNRLKVKAVKDVLPTLPAVGESLHVVADGKFDFWTFTPHIIELMGGRADEFYASTWTMNRTNALEILELYDTGKVGEINLLSGLYFKRRETAVYATIAEGIQQRGQRYIAFANHAKVLLLGNDQHRVTVEGSANFTGNPRLEQYVVTNDPKVFDFHKQWMGEMLNATHTKKHE